MNCKFSSLVLVFFLFAATCYAIPVGEVKEICKKAKSPSLCFTLLNSSPQASLVGLTQYTIDIARANVTNTIKLINNLIAQSAKNPVAKRHYTLCLGHFGSEGALRDVGHTQELLKKGDYNGVNVAASSIIDDVEDCISGESPTDPPYHDPSQLPHYASVLELIVDIILVLANVLIG